MRSALSGAVAALCSCTGFHCSNLAYCGPHRYARLERAGANLMSVNLTGAYLIRANLIRANLMGADLPSRPGHDQRAVKARAALPRMRAGEPRASMRACSYHASPGPGQGNVLWIGLWMIYVNTLVNRSTAVDEGCCGKVDNRCETGSCQVAGLPRSVGRYKVSTGEPATPPYPLLWEGAKQSRRYPWP